MTGESDSQATSAPSQSTASEPLRSTSNVVHENAAEDYANYAADSDANDWSHCIEGVQCCSHDVSSVNIARSCCNSTTYRSARTFQSTRRVRKLHRSSCTFGRALCSCTRRCSPASCSPSHSSRLRRHRCHRLHHRHLHTGLGFVQSSTGVRHRFQCR